MGKETYPAPLKSASFLLWGQSLRLSTLSGTSLGRLGGRKKKKGKKKIPVEKLKNYSWLTMVEGKTMKIGGLGTNQQEGRVKGLRNVLMQRRRKGEGIVNKKGGLEIAMV